MFLLALNCPIPPRSSSWCPVLSSSSQRWAQNQDCVKHRGRATKSGKSSLSDSSWTFWLGGGLSQMLHQLVCFCFSGLCRAGWLIFVDLRLSLEQSPGYLLRSLSQRESVSLDSFVLSSGRPVIIVSNSAGVLDPGRDLPHLRQGSWLLHFSLSLSFCPLSPMTDHQRAFHSQKIQRFEPSHHFGCQQLAVPGGTNLSSHWDWIDSLLLPPSRL